MGSTASSIKFFPHYARLYGTAYAEAHWPVEKLIASNVRPALMAIASEMKSLGEESARPTGVFNP